MTTKAEIWVMLPQAKEFQEPPETGRGKEEFSQSLQRKHSPDNEHLDIGLLACGTGKNKFLLF